MIKENRLLGKLLISLPEIQEVVRIARKKYDIPEVSPGDDGITKIMLARNDIDWNEVSQYIQSQIRSNAELFPPEFVPYLNAKDLASLPDEPDIYEPISENFRNTVTKLYRFFVTTVRSQLPLYLNAIDQYCGAMTDTVIEYLITGRGREVPSDWIGKVATSSVFGETVVMALASELTDQKWILANFKSELKKVFGEKQRRITDEDMSSADYLAMLVSGKTYRDVVDADMKANPDIYRFNKKTHSYEPSYKTRKDTLRKRVDRLKEFIRDRVKDRN